MVSTLIILSTIIIIYFLLQAAWYGVTLLYSFKDVIDSYREAYYGNLDEIIEKGNYLPVSLVIPVFNEEKRILNAIYSILKSKYKNTQIVIVNDGSSDNTLGLLIKEFDLYEIPIIINQRIPTSKVKGSYKSNLYPNLSVIDKEHSPANNAADAVNCGVNAVVTPVFITFDADTVLEPEAITRILLKFLSKPHCIMVGGVIYVLNGNVVENGTLLTNRLPTTWVPSFQSLEYIRSFSYGRSGLNMFSGALCNPGAFSLSETNAIRQVKGFDRDNFSYDAEMTIKLHHLTRKEKYPTKIYFVSSAISWTEVPGTLKSFWKQRDKWQRGMLLSALKYKQMFLNPFYGITGLLVFPAYVLFDLLAPVVEFISYVLLIFVIAYHVFTIPNILWAIFLAWGYIIVMTISSFYLNFMTLNRFSIKTLWPIVWISTVEMLGFRQYRAACAVYATFHYFIDRLRGKPI